MSDNNPKNSNIYPKQPLVENDEAKSGEVPIKTLYN